MTASDGHRSVSSLIRALAPYPGDEIADPYRLEMRAAYWEAKDLAAALAIGYAAVSRCLAEAAASEGHVALARRAEAKGFLYDIASFAWPGWDEPGITVDADSARLGFDAAEANLALAVELHKDDLPMARAHWMLGAHRLTAGLPGDAEGSFVAAAGFADRAESAVDAALARAFASLARLVDGKLDADRDLDTDLATLAELPDGAMFVEQVATARRVLER